MLFYRIGRLAMPQVRKSYRAVPPYFFIIMKQKLLFALMVLCMSLCSNYVWAIERPEPVFPKASTLESGKYYYLYNVGADKWLGISTVSSSYAGVVEFQSAISLLAEYRSTVSNKITYTGYSLKTSNNYYLTTNNGSDIRTHDAQSVNSYAYWTFAEADGGYTFQRAPYNTYYYDENQFVGWNDNSSDKIYANLTEGNIVWKLIEQDDYLRYKHKLGLYEALQLADVKGWPYFTYKKYDDIYKNENSLTAEIQNAKDELNRMILYNTSEYFVNSSATDVPMVFGGEKGWNYDKGWCEDPYANQLTYASISGGSTKSITAYVKVDRHATFSGKFSYKVYGYWSTSNTGYYNGYCYRNYITMDIYVDGKLIHSFDNKMPIGDGSYWGNYYPRYFNEIEPGEHVIEWRFTNTSTSGTYYIHPDAFNVHYTDKHVSVSLLEPGSLGTEVLYNVDYIKDVRCLKVKGQMNNDDWAKIGMMTNLNTLDLSEAQFTSIPEKGLYGMTWLHKVSLPEGVKTIGKRSLYALPIVELILPTTVETIEEDALDYCRELKALTIPSSVKKVGDRAFGSMGALEYVDWQSDANIPINAFLNNYNLKTVNISGNPNLIDDYAFQYCFSLEKVNFANSIKTIGQEAFYQDYNLGETTLPTSLTEIKYRAFYQCSKFTTTFPEKLNTIGNYAFYQCDALGNNGPLSITARNIGNYAFQKCPGLLDIELPHVSSIGTYAFDNCQNLRKVELAVDYDAISTSNQFTNCNNLVEVVLRSPSVVVKGDYPLMTSLKDVTLKVPSFVVNNYKLDEYWYNAKEILGFGTGDIKDWVIKRPVVLNHDRFEGTPNVEIVGSSLKINGDTPMTINNITFSNTYLGSSNTSSLISALAGQIISNCDNIRIVGDVEVPKWSKAKYWYFFSLPFDIKVSDIKHSVEGVQKAVRYYDGANRAAYGASGSWRNYAEDAVIPAGTGFIIQTNVDTWTYFRALDNASKQQCVKNREFVKTLAVNDCENKSDRGWNLVGNPWQCYYNDHALNFTGPITVWSVTNKTYTAYSITDDDYAISPNQAFFVQCPNEQYNTIGFPTNGRQLTNVIESQNAAKANNAASTRRMIVDVKISNGENEDQTRVVLNEQASLDYEIACDASKMMSMDASVPQIFTMDADGTQYAINERPTDNTVVPLGFFAPADGEYTILLGRNSAETVVLVDYETGAEQDIVGAEYSFSANAGMNEGRFALKFSAGETTGISNVENVEKPATVVYNLAGQRISRNVKGINIVNGRKIVNK